VAIRYTDSVEGIDAGMLGGFFEAWKRPRTPEEHLAILKHSTRVVLASDDDTGQVVGFVNALSDGMQSAFVPLLEVLPEYRGLGIGTELMRRMLTRLTGVSAIDLTCDPSLQPFYARLGMAPSVGMILRKY